MENGGNGEGRQAKLRLMTWNVGMLRFRKGPFCYEPVPFVDARLRALPRALIESGADVVALQELFDEADRRAVVEAVRDVYPFVVGGMGANGSIQKGSGLMILSRHPFLSSKFVPYTVSPWEEDLTMRKGVLRARIATPQGIVSLLNTHTASGGVRHPDIARGARGFVRRSSRSWRPRRTSVRMISWSSPAI